MARLECHHKGIDNDQQEDQCHCIFLHGEVLIHNEAGNIGNW